MNDDDGVYGEDNEDGRLEPDRVIWIGRPSQWVNFPSLVVYIAIGLGVFVGRGYFVESRLFYKYRELLPHIDTAILLLLAFLGLKYLYQLLSTFYTKYELTNERLIEFTGITKVFQNGEPLELYNVYDYQFPPPLLLAIFGRGTLRILTHDANQPEVDLLAIRNPRAVYETIRSRVEQLRLTKKAYFNEPH